jgi:hypothetical protein
MTIDEVIKQNTTGPIGIKVTNIISNSVLDNSKEERTPTQANRSLVERRRHQVAISGQTASTVQTITDFGREGISSGSTSSQIELNHFQETRLITSADIRRRMVEAATRLEQMRLQAQLSEDCDNSIDE